MKTLLDQLTSIELDLMDLEYGGLLKPEEIAQIGEFRKQLFKMIDDRLA